jgi:hypothetical protein
MASTHGLAAPPWGAPSPEWGARAGCVHQRGAPRHAGEKSTPERMTKRRAVVS